MVKQKKRTQSWKNCAINCAFQGVRLIWKQKIWLAIFEFLWSLTNQNALFVSSFCTELTLFCTVFEKNCTALNQSKWRNFFMYIISGNKALVLSLLLRRLKKRHPPWNVTSKIVASLQLRHCVHLDFFSLGLVQETTFHLTERLTNEVSHRLWNSILCSLRQWPA